MRNEAFQPLYKSIQTPDKHFPASESQIKEKAAPRQLAWEPSSGEPFVEVKLGEKDDKNRRLVQIATTKGPKARGSCCPSVLMRNTLVDSGRWYYEVSVVKCGKELASVGWATPNYFGDAFKFEGVGYDRFSWAYISRAYDAQETDGASKQIDHDNIQLKLPGCAHASKKLAPRACTRAVERFTSWLPGDPCEVVDVYSIEVCRSREAVTLFAFHITFDHF
tara:strand:- start:1129 stop:1791 length:663 start_codon:yes stop_codon:yes gene_type:complete